MSDYSPLSITEMDVRNFTTPPLDYDDVSTAEILLKIEIVETYVKRKWFEGASIPIDGRIPVLILVVSNILTRSDLARKYGSIKSETLGDYSYELSTVDDGTNPLEVLFSWQRMAKELLHDLSADKKYQVRLSNE